MRKLLRARQRFKGVTIGLDVHKKFIQYTVLDRQGNEVAAGRMQSTRLALRSLILKYKSSGQVQIALEACGCFWWVYCESAEVAGRENVHVGQPLKIRVIAQSQEKNDANDAWWLAYLLWDCRLPEAYVAEGDLRELRIAGRELRYSINRRSDLIRRVRSHLSQEGIELPASWHSSAVKRKFTRRVLRQFSGQRGAALRELYIQIMRESSGIGRWRQRVAELTSKFKDLRSIRTEIPGMGEITAGALYGELGDPKRYRSAKAYAKATGLTPSYRESGGKGRVGQITRAGSALARWALTRAVLSCMRCKKGAGMQIRAWMDNRLARGRNKRKTIVAAARKLAEGVWRLLAWGETFDLKRAFAT
jgi:transposase